jgi:hypothetical protein
MPWVSTYGQALHAQIEQLRGASCTKIYTRREPATGAKWPGSDFTRNSRLLAAVARGPRVGRRRQRGLAGRLGSELSKDRPQALDARRER